MANLSDKQTIVAIPDASTSQKGLVNKGLSQIKYLAGDATGTTDLTDLDFTLTIGRTYMITAHVKFELLAADAQAIFRWRDNTTQINSQDCVHAAGVTDVQTQEQTSTLIHTMVSTDLNFQSVSSSGDILGDGSSTETWVQVTDVTDLFEIGTVT